MKKNFLYRDGGNYKTFFEWEVTTEGEELKPGDEITMGQFGTPTQSEFFESETHPYMYNAEYDHNILEVTE